jgi:hypothetical protein
VVESTPPVISGLPPNQAKEATGPYGVHFTFSITVKDPDDGGTFSCTGGSVTAFPFPPVASISYTITAPVGVTVVTCTATDSHGNVAAPRSFTLTVTDRTPPVVTVPPVIVTLATSPAGATVAYSATAKDLVDGTDPVACKPASGSVFKSGTTIVTCTSVDAHGNKATSSFTVTVVGAADQLAALRLTVAAAKTLPAALRTRLLADLDKAAQPSTPAACQGLAQFEADVQGNTAPAGPISNALSTVWIAAANSVSGARGCSP